MMTVQEEAEKYFDIGMECDKNKDFAGAINNFSKVIEIDPNNEYAYFNRGNIYCSLGKYKEAISDYTKTIEINANYIDAYIGRGDTFDKINKYEEAIKDYNEVIKIDSEFQEFRFAIGVLYIKLKDLHNAKENFEKLIKFIESEIEKNEGKENDHISLPMQDDILNFIVRIVFEDLIGDNKKLILVELIYYCYQLMTKIRFRDDNFKLTHYTKTGNLKFLLKKRADFGKLRLSNAVYMNDPQEGQIFKILLSKYKDNKSSNIVRNNIDIKNYTYLACFCPYEKRDVLPMWVHYGDGGKGVGLIFNEKFFENQELYKVQYIDTENFAVDTVDKNISEELKQIFDFLSQDIFTKSEEHIFWEYTNIIINYISYFFKDKAYEYENEVRMVQFRDYESKDIILDENFEVPKLYIEYNKEIITENCEEIIVGPKGSFEEISAYGKYIGMKQCTKSKIQYR